MLHIQPFPNDIYGRVEYLPEPAPVYSIEWPRDSTLSIGQPSPSEVASAPSLTLRNPQSPYSTATHLKMNTFPDDWRSDSTSFASNRHGFLEPGLGITASESPISRRTTQGLQSPYQYPNCDISHQASASANQVDMPFQGSWTFTQHPTPPTEEYMESRVHAPGQYSSFTSVHGMGPPPCSGQCVRTPSSSDAQGPAIRPDEGGKEKTTTLAPASFTGQRLMAYSPASWTETPAVLPRWTPHFPSPVPSMTQVPDLTFTPAATPISDDSPLNMHAHQNLQGAVAVSPRERPHMRQSYSQDSYSTRQHHYKRRTMSAEHFWANQQAHLASPHAGVQTPQTIELPPVTSLPSTIIAEQQAHGIPSAKAPRLGPIRPPRGTLSGSRPRYKPYLPPHEDLNNVDERQRPIQQEPAFEGDLYTPRWKRRNKEGRWEGWCDMCPKGRWLDLKNSRYWEDKMRNHGICARTKRSFPDPLNTRWVTGNAEDIRVVAPPDPSRPDPELEPRKRQAQCGTCLKWVDMDGQRTRARDRAVGWWMHAYRCSKQELLTSQRSAALSEDAAK